MKYKAKSLASYSRNVQTVVLEDVRSDGFMKALRLCNLDELRTIKILMRNLKKDTDVRGYIVYKAMAKIVHEHDDPPGGGSNESARTQTWTEWINSEWDKMRILFRQEAI